jgi:hypothetical protein
MTHAEKDLITIIDRLVPESSIGVPTSSGCRVTGVDITEAYVETAAEPKE